MAAQCPICAHRAEHIQAPGGADFNEYDCIRCGRYRIVRSLLPGLPAALERVPPAWIVLSRMICRAQAKDRDPLVLDTSNIKTLLAGAEFPRPIAQADDLVILLGRAQVPAGTYVALRVEFLMGYLGTGDRGEKAKQTGLLEVTKWLQAQEQIEISSQGGPGGAWLVRLTVKGWERYDTLIRENPESRIAFMAMSYGSADTTRAVVECFVPAVAATGFELRRLDTKPKSGLIDLRMRVDIRACKFMVADLSDANNGAYWEAGFAEGLGRHVFYTCERGKFKDPGTHFDTEHLLTIQWSLDKLPDAAEDLKAAIRNTFPAEARQRD